jgi:GTP cyclohydrolase IB
MVCILAAGLFSPAYFGGLGPKRIVSAGFPKRALRLGTMSALFRPVPPVTTRPTSLSTMPDVAGDAAAAARALDWVGMRNIALPLRVRGDDGVVMQVPASVDVLVDLRDPDARGIHMSRLYRQLQDTLVEEVLTPARLRRVLHACIESQGALSSSARLTLRFDQMLKRRALASDNSGWKRYPLEIDAVLVHGHLSMTLAFSVEYSSTCPASTALSRQLNAERFAEDFAAAHPLTTCVDSGSRSNCSRRSTNCRSPI